MSSGPREVKTSASSLSGSNTRSCIHLSQSVHKLLSLTRWPFEFIKYAKSFLPLATTITTTAPPHTPDHYHHLLTPTLAKVPPQLFSKLQFIWNLIWYSGVLWSNWTGPWHHTHSLVFGGTAQATRGTNDNSDFIYIVANDQWPLQLQGISSGLLRDLHSHRHIHMQIKKILNKQVVLGH